MFFYMKICYICNILHMDSLLFFPQLSRDIFQKNGWGGGEVILRLICVSKFRFTWARGKKTWSLILVCWFWEWPISLHMYLTRCYICNDDECFFIWNFVTYDFGLVSLTLVRMFILYVVKVTLILDFMNML